MSKMSQELEKRLDENKYEMWEALKDALEEIEYAVEDENYALITKTQIRGVLNKIKGKDDIQTQP